MDVITMPKKDEEKEKDKDTKKKDKKKEEKSTASKSASDSDSSSSDDAKETSKDDSADDIRKKIKTEVVGEEKKDSDTEDKKDSKKSDDKSDGMKDKSSEDDSSKDEKKKEEKKEKTLPTVSSFSMLDQKSAMTDEPSSDNEEKDSEEKDSEQSDSEDKGEKEKKSKKKEEISSDEVKEWLKDVRPDTSKESHKEGKPTMKIVLIVLMALAILAAVVGGVFYYRQGVGEGQEEAMEGKAEVLPTTPPSEPSPTPGDEITAPANLSEYLVNVLNGSGVAGEAGNVSDLLETAGFEGVEAGNADSYDYADTEVQMKEDVPDAVYEAIEEALSDEYVVSRVEDTLDETDEYDVVVIVGSSSPEE